METDVIKEKLVYLKTLLEKLKKVLTEYSQEKDIERKDVLFAAMTKYSEEIVETAIKINNKFLEEKNDFASTYYQTFLKLEKHYVFKKSNLKLLAKTTSLRNKAAHEYEILFSQLDETILKYKSLLKLYPNYIEDILNLLNNSY